MTDLEGGPPSVDRHRNTRVALRVSGGVALPVGLVLVALGLADFFGAMSSPDFGRQPAGGAFCRRCGRWSLAEARFCSSCGQPIA